MILPRLTSRPSISESTYASNASSSFSSLPSLFVNTQRMGMNRADLPRPSVGTRSTAWRHVSSFWDVEIALNPSRHLDVLRLSWAGATAHSSCGTSDRKRSIAASRYDSFWLCTHSAYGLPAVGSPVNLSQHLVEHLMWA